MEKIMLGSALAEMAGSLKDFAEKLGGDEGVQWMAAFKRFLRKEEPWPKFIYDKTKDGWELLEDVDFTLIGPLLELVPFLKAGEDSIGGEEMVRRARGELRANLGQRYAEYLLEHQQEIPKEFRKYYIVFTGTIWCHPPGRPRVAYLHWNGEQWVLDFRWLELGCDSDDRLPRPRNSLYFPRQKRGFLCSIVYSSRRAFCRFPLIFQKAR